MELLEAVERSKKNHRKRGMLPDWAKVAEFMGNEKSPEQYRQEYRVKHGDKRKQFTKVNATAERAFNKGKKDPQSIIISELTKERTIQDLVRASGLSRLEVLGMIEQLRLDGYDIVQCRFGDEVAYTVNKASNATYYEYKHYHDVDKVIKIGLTSDRHTGSKYFQKTFLKMAYEDFQREGVTSVYDCGDMSDGMYNNRPGAIYELYALGFDQQVDSIVNDHPMIPGITTYFLTGNHDATHQMNGGANIGKAIEARRPDMKYLGHEYAKIWLTPKVDLDLIHPRDGTSYALSYKLQKRIDAMSGGSKPKIMVTGHYHKNFFMFYRNIWAISMASFQAQSPFMRGMGLVSDVGYMILEIKVNEHGDLIEVTPKYKSLYEMIQETY